MPGAPWFEQELEQEFKDKPHLEEFYRALLIAAQDEHLLQRLLWEVTTFSERKMLAKRWEAIVLLLSGLNQAEVARQTGLSTKTINNAAKWVLGPYSAGACAETLRRLREQEKDLEVTHGTASEEV